MKRLLVGASLLCAFALAGQSQAAGVKIGTLSCHEAGGWGFIFGGSNRVHCIYSGGGRAERYTGDISKFGVDIGYQRSGVILWDVVAPTMDIERGALAGHYGGVTAEASAVIGAGANALIGGSHRSFALQPVSIEGTTGLNVAAGIGELTLHYEPDS